MAKPRFDLLKSARVLYRWARYPHDRNLRRRGIDPYLFRRLDLRWLKAIEFEAVVDVGAYVGEYSLTMREVLPEAKFFAFEPLPENFAIAQKRLESLPEIRVHNVAIGRESGTLEFHRSEFAPSSSALEMHQNHKANFPYTAQTSSIVVPCLTLDEALKPYGIGGKILLKIDVQGFEEQVLLGAPQTLKQVAVVWVETSFVELYRGQPLFERIYSFLIDNGFKYKGNHEQMLSPLDDTVLQSDSIFVRATPQN